MAGTASEVLTEDRKLTHLEKKKAEVTELLSKRDQKRVANAQIRKEEKEHSAASNENVNFISDNLNRAKIEVEDGIQRCDTIDKCELPDHFDSLILKVHEMQKFLNDSAVFLAPYYVEKAQETIAKLNVVIQEKKDDLIPKKKFAFRSKKKVGDKPKPLGADVVDSSKRVEKRIEIELTEKRFTDTSNQTLSMPEEELSQSDVVLSQLTDCTVKLLGTPSTIHGNRLRGCTVFCGPVSSSIFVDECSDCTFIAACQQLRVHSTQDCKFYLHVTSRAIIEDSKGLLFAPYNLNYEGLNGHYEKSKLNKNRNAWNDVDDFNWLASDTHSPNWAVMPEAERTTKWNV